ncbi:MAG: vWA domain-containing protein [Polyangiaceae bacterium]
MRLTQGASFGRFLVNACFLGALLSTACSGTEEGVRKPGTTKDGGSSGTTGGSGGGGSGGSGGSGIGGSGGSGTGGTTPPIGPGTGPSDAAIPPNDGKCAAVEQETEIKKQPADIIWVVDNSGSMTAEAQAVQDNMNIFAKQIVASGIDVRVTLLSNPQTIILGIPIGNGICVGAPLGSGKCPDDSLHPNYLHLNVNVGSWDALNLIVNNFQAYKSMLRPNASKTFVVVTDDEATAAPNNSAAAFTQAIQALDPVLFQKFTFSGVYCTQACLNCSAVGNVYDALRKQTGGVVGDMCITDFAPVFKALAEAVITGSKLECDWAIPPPPMGQMFDPKLVNVLYTQGGTTPRDLFKVPTAADCDAQGGWYYDDNAKPTRVISCPATCTEIQADIKAKISVAFGCQTKIIVK